MTAPVPVPDGTTPPAEAVEAAYEALWQNQSAYDVAADVLHRWSQQRHAPDERRAQRADITQPVPRRGDPMTPIDPPSEGQAPRAASAGLVQPPPGLLDKVAEAMHEGLPCDKHRDGECAYMPKARAAWDAVAEGLGLTEERHPFPVWGERPRTAQDSGLDDTPVSVIERWTVARRLVSKWEPQP